MKQINSPFNWKGTSSIFATDIKFSGKRNEKIITVDKNGKHNSVHSNGSITASLPNNLFSKAVPVSRLVKVK